MVGSSFLRRAKKVVSRGGRSERGESSNSAEQPQEEQTQPDQTYEEAVPQRTPHRHSCDEGILLIDPDGSVRRRRGKTTCNDIQNLPPGNRVNIEINEQGIPYNQPEATLLSSYLGVIARDATLAPISFTDWRNSGLDIYKKRMLEEVEAKFQIPPQIRKWIMSSIGVKWRNYKTHLKSDYFAETMSYRQIVENMPEGVDLAQWALLVQQWFDPRDKERAAKNTTNAKMQQCPHTLGRKSTVRQQLETDVQDRLQLWKVSRIHRDGTWSSEDAKHRWELACSMLAEHDLTPEDGNIEENERVFRAVMGPEHPGRVRNMGFGIAPIRFFPQSSSSASSSNRSTASSSQLGRQLHMQEQMERMQSEISELKEMMKEHLRRSRRSRSPSNN